MKFFARQILLFKGIWMTASMQLQSIVTLLNTRSVNCHKTGSSDSICLKRTALGTSRLRCVHTTAWIRRSSTPGTTPGLMVPHAVMVAVGQVQCGLGTWMPQVSCVHDQQVPFTIYDLWSHNDGACLSHALGSTDTVLIKVPAGAVDLSAFLAVCVGRRINLTQWAHPNGRSPVPIKFNIC